ncbi:hypothetical protein XA68_12602 [Ophiocordyceps unilateralis]|uniref:Uncharacterized protein n=1 Tax=Ophiocordyceps unilateralis TaxID=268505 RepID=A0A2A9PEC3_OPHUN|nr:hypothetical protein XA68_12602 [Ophiocordyceps unilateralis]
MNHARVRRDAWNEEARRIKSGSDGTDADANSRQMQLLSWCRRGELLEWLLSSRRRTQVQEIENAVEWTQQYGHAVCDLLEMSRLDGEAQSVTPSLESPAREDEEQGVEEGRGGERDEADEGEDDDEDDDDEGEDDDEDDEYDDEGDDEDDRAARRRLAEQHLVFMRSRKPLCLEVLQDSTQTQQQLQEAQEEERQSILAS